MKTSYPTPADLLQRCMKTIPSTAVVQPRPLLESPSRTRLLLLAAAATVPIVAVLVVIPVKHYLSQRQENIPEDANGNIPYRRTEMYRIEDLNRNGGTKQYTLTIADVRGEYRGVMKPNFKEEDESHSMNFLLLPGVIYSRTQDKVSTLSSVTVRPKRDNKLDYNALVWGGKLVSEGTVVWEGQKLLKRMYVIPALKLQKKHGYYAFRRELFSDPGTHTLRIMREWSYVTKDDPTKANGAILTMEAHYYYNPRPEDAQYFDVKRFLQGATVTKRLTDKDLQPKTKSKP